MPAAHRPSLTLLAAFAGLKLAVQLAFVRGYGWFRDEFYYLACSHRLDFGYVDHPPLSIWLLAGWRSLFGDSLVATRIPPALAGAATVAVVGWIAARLGGDRRAQALAMASAVALPLWLGTNHVYSMNAFDMLFWALAAAILVELLRTDRPPLRLWVALGVVLGLGLLNKISVLWLGFGIAAGLLLTARRRALTTPGPWVAGAIAAALFAPYVLWNAAHDWATLEFIEQATSTKMAGKSVAEFAVDQLFATGLLPVVIWGTGLVWLFAARGGRFRLLGWVWLAVFGLLAFSGTSRSGYLGPAYTWLLAAGAVGLVERLGRRGVLAWGLAALILAWGALLAPLALPVLPVERYVEYARAFGEEPSTEERKEVGVLKQFYADMHGWHRIVDAVEEAAATLTSAERERAIVFAGNYGVAGALERLGRGRDLPPAFSGHNNYWMWGPPDHPVDVVIVVGGDAEDHARNWDSVDRVTETDCGLCMPYENGNGVFVLRGRSHPVGEIWSTVRHYD